MIVQWHCNEVMCMNYEIGLEVEYVCGACGAKVNISNKMVM